MDIEKQIQRMVVLTVLKMQPDKSQNVLTMRDATKILKHFAGREFLRKGEAANYLGVGSTTFWRWRQQYKITSYTLDGVTVYKRSDLETFYDDNAIKSYV